MAEIEEEDLAMEFEGAGAWSSDMMTEMNSLHAQHVSAVTSQATSAAWHADIAAKQAASLAQWVQYLWGQVATLQEEVKDLEDWKKKSLEEMNRLRAAHKALRKNVMPDAEEESPSPPKSKSMPRLDTPEREEAVPKSVTVADLSPSPLAAAELPLDDGALEGVAVNPVNIDGVDLQRAQWRIPHLSQKLKSCMGRSLVSSPFTAWGLEDLRLMVFPDSKDSFKTQRTKKQKEQYTKMVTEGPLEGCLKFKVSDCPAPHVLEYYLKVGNARKGPFRHNFSESTVHGCAEFDVDWLQEVESDQSLTVTVEIMKP